ncbi:hypothetical protein [Microbacterium sp. UFMG61]|uniref:hypothetical protein n=1 Tax=Microbacterium sp. UFMG61 TaxID=2745935 RepID=UPI00188F55F9|nr:hypothetical protein [Microbacterium sp. UFMG61]
MHPRLSPYAKREDRHIGPGTGVVSSLVLDIIYIALTLALFALVSLVAKGVERL